MAEPFVGPPRPAPWFPCGLASSFVDITQANAGPLSQIAPCSTEDPQPTGCRVFLAPSKNGGDTGSDTVIELSRDPKDQVNKTLRAGDQVLVFKYNGKIHAIDNKCPHSSYPLSNATPFDIEDFGITLSAGVTCPKHDWSFDLFTGNSDRGGYKLKLWEVQMRPSGQDGDSEVWVRKKGRIG